MFLPIAFGFADADRQEHLLLLTHLFPIGFAEADGDREEGYRRSSFFQMDSSCEKRSLFYTVSLLPLTSRELRKDPGVNEISIGSVAPMPSHTATTVPIKKTAVATGRRKGF